ncbi:MAG: hypothetical protein ACOVRK_02390 [Chryseobacterium taeanense]
MKELIVIKYTGEHNKWGNLDNVSNSFKRDSGVAPLQILNEESSEAIVENLNNYNNQDAHLVVHVQSHGFTEGLCMETLEDATVGRAETLFRWEDFVNILNSLSLRCAKLTVNLTAVCNSSRMLENNMHLNFDLLYSIVTISNTVEPMKINKRIFEGADLKLKDIYRYKPRKPRTALAVWNSGGKGKTESVRELAYALLSFYSHYRLLYTSAPKVIIPKFGDFRLVITINGNVIAIESQGDPKTGLQSRLHDLIRLYAPDMVICTCRTRGETVHAVESLIPWGYEIIWSSTYQLSGRFQQMVANTLKGRHLLELLQTLRKI